MTRLRRERLAVVAVEALGPYRLLRLRRGNLEPGSPGQFFMLQPPGHVLPRPMSLCVAPPGELGFLIDPIGSGTRDLVAASPGETIAVLGPLGNGFDLRVERPYLVGGGIGIAPLPYLAESLTSPQRARPQILLGFRTTAQAEASTLLPDAVVVIDPVLVTDALPGDPGQILACGPEPMLEAVRSRFQGAQLAWEAPMACGFGACFGCVVAIDGTLRRLCVEGPVLRGAPDTLNRLVA